MNDCQYLHHWHLVYAMPIWTLGTWLLILILAWCLIILKRQVICLLDRVGEVRAMQDAYFGVGDVAHDAESIRIRDMEVRRLRGQVSEGVDCGEVEEL